MARKQDPIIGVVHFFETEGLAVVQAALALARTIVRRRTPAGKPKPKPRRKPVKVEQPPTASASRRASAS